MIRPEVLKEIIFYSKAVAAIGGAGGVVWAVIWSITSFFHKVSEIGNNVVTLQTNHFPHLESTLKEHGETLSLIRTDQRVMDTKIESYGKSVDEAKGLIDKLSTAFMDHIQNPPAQEVTVRVRNKKSDKTSTFSKNL